jgi:hypothetical protein
MNEQDRTDRAIDDRVRDVPVPAGLAARAAPNVLFDDAALDRLLLGMDLPDGLESRVRLALVADVGRRSMPLGDGLSRAAPAGMTARPAGRTGRFPSGPFRWLLSGELLADTTAVAAALAIVGAMFFAGTELSRRLAMPDATKQLTAARGGRPRATSVTAAPVAGMASRPPEPAARAGAAAAAADRHAAIAKRPEQHAGPTAVPAEEPAEEPAPAGDAGAGGRAVQVRAAPEFSPARAAARGDAGGIRTVILPTAGRKVPRVTGFDLAFEMAHGEAPFVDPAAAPELATDHPPLTLRTDSFDAIGALVGRDGGQILGSRTGRAGLPVVRVEEILAALPAATDAGAWQGPGIGLSIDAVRSLRPQPASLLVEVCATAPDVAAAAGEPVAEPLDAMLLLDQSGGPFASVSWQWLCRGLARVVARMRSADRLSLVVCGERPRVVALRADAAQLAGLLPELLREQVVKSADFDAAFRLATAVGRREGAPDRIVAVAHAGSLEQCREEGRRAFVAWQSARAAGVAVPGAAAVGFVVVDPQPPLVAGDDRVTSESANGWVAADPIAIGRAMVARAFGRPTLVATDCRLEVVFDPARVGSYRLVGHRQTAADALAADGPRPIDLHVGESVRVVYEIVRRPGQAAATGAGPVAATFFWKPVGSAGTTGGDREGTAAGGGVSRVRAVLGDGNAAWLGSGRAATDGARAELPSRRGCELALAVAVGELLGGSVHAEPWRQKAAAVAALVSGWRARGDVTPQGRLLIECLEHQGIGLEPAGR